MEKTTISISIDIEKEYKPQYTLFSNNTDELLRLKEIVFNDLTQAERNALLFYAEAKSQRKLAEKLNVSPALANRYLKKIRNKIKTIYDNTNNT